MMIGNVKRQLPISNRERLIIESAITGMSKAGFFSHDIPCISLMKGKAVMAALCPTNTDNQSIFLSIPEVKNRVVAGAI